MNNWTEIKIEVNSADIDKAGDIANVVVPYGIYIEDYTNLEQTVEDIAHIDLIDEDLLKKDRNKAYVHIYLEPDVSPAEAVAFLSERYDSEGHKADNRSELVRKLRHRRQNRAEHRPRTGVRHGRPRNHAPLP